MLFFGKTEKTAALDELRNGSVSRELLFDMIEVA